MLGVGSGQGDSLMRIATGRLVGLGYIDRSYWVKSRLSSDRFWLHHSDLIEHKSGLDRMPLALPLQSISQKGIRHRGHVSQGIEQT